VFNTIFFENPAVYEKKSGKMLQSGAGHRWNHGTCPCHSGYL